MVILLWASPPTVTLMGAEDPGVLHPSCLISSSFRPRVLLFVCLHKISVLEEMAFHFIFLLRQRSLLTSLETTSFSLCLKISREILISHNPYRWVHTQECFQGQRYLKMIWPEFSGSRAMLWSLLHGHSYKLVWALTLIQKMPLLSPYPSAPTTSNMYGKYVSQAW